MRKIYLQTMFDQSNLYERLNGEFRDRLKCTRGLKSNNPAIVRLLIIHHNFFGERTGLKSNMTPVQANGVDIMPISDSDLAPKCDKRDTFI